MSKAIEFLKKHKKRFIRLILVFAFALFLHVNAKLYHRVKFTETISTDAFGRLMVDGQALDLVYGYSVDKESKNIFVRGKNIVTSLLTRKQMKYEKLSGKILLQRRICFLPKNWSILKRLRTLTIMILTKWYTTMR